MLLSLLSFIHSYAYTITDAFTKTFVDDLLLCSQIKLDSVAKGLPPCMRAISATALT